MLSPNEIIYTKLTDTHKLYFLTSVTGVVKQDSRILIYPKHQEEAVTNKILGCSAHELDSRAGYTKAHTHTHTHNEVLINAL